MIWVHIIYESVFNALKGRLPCPTSSLAKSWGPALGPVSYFSSPSTHDEGMCQSPCLSSGTTTADPETRIPGLYPGFTGQTLGLCLTNSELLCVLCVCSHGLEYLPPCLG